MLKYRIAFSTYELEKLFQDGGKKNHFTCNDITGIDVEFESRTNSRLVIICQYYLMSNKHIQTWLVCSWEKLIPNYKKTNVHLLQLSPVALDPIKFQDI